jgi:hypothetical protein
MDGYDTMCLDVFLENQLQLFPERVAENREEAAEFLDEVLAVICRDKRELRRYFDEAGTDMTGITDYSEIEEVFPLPDGRFLVVDA